MRPKSGCARKPESGRLDGNTQSICAALPFLWTDALLVRTHDETIAPQAQATDGNRRPRNGADDGIADCRVTVDGG